MTFIFDYKSRASEKKKRIGWAGGGQWEQKELALPPGMNELPPNSKGLTW